MTHQEFISTTGGFDSVPLHTEAPSGPEKLIEMLMKENKEMKDKMMAIEQQNKQKIDQLESKIYKIEKKSVHSAESSFVKEMGGSKELESLGKQMIENVSAIAPVKEKFDESECLLIKTDDDPQPARSPSKPEPFNYQIQEQQTIEQIPQLQRPQLSPVKEHRSPIKAIPIDDIILDNERPETVDLDDLTLDLPQNNLQNTQDNIMPAQADSIPLEFSSQESYLDLADVSRPKYNEETPFPYGGETTMSDNLGLTIFEDNERNEVPTSLKEKAERAMIQHLNKKQDQESAKKSRSTAIKSHTSAAAKFVRDTPLIQTPQLSVNNSNFTNQIDPDEIIVEEVNDVYDEFGVLLEEEVVSVEKKDRKSRIENSAKRSSR